MSIHFLQSPPNIQPENGISLAFPYRIGCNLGGGIWRDYLTIIRRFAVRNPSWRITIFNIGRKPGPQGELVPVTPDAMKQWVEKRRRETSNCATTKPQDAEMAAAVERTHEPTGTPLMEARTHNQPLWITYRTNKISTMINPHNTKRMMAELPEGASWTGRRRTKGRMTDGTVFDLHDNFQQPLERFHNRQLNNGTKWRATVKCEYKFVNNAPDTEPIFTACPVTEIVGNQITIHHKGRRSCLSVPEEHPDIPQNKDLYTGERFTMGEYVDGQPIYECDDWKVNGKTKWTANGKA